jgi:hypothetical protein
MAFDPLLRVTAFGVVTTCGPPQATRMSARHYSDRTERDNASKPKKAAPDVPKLALVLNPVDQILSFRDKHLFRCANRLTAR